MLLKEGEKIHVMIRRLFEKDACRHFIGVVKQTSSVAARVEGRSFILNVANAWERKQRVRTTIISLTDSRLIINILPANAELENVEYNLKDDHVIVTDGKTFEMDIEDFQTRRWEQPSF